MLIVYMLPIAVRIYWGNVFLGSVSYTVLDTVSLKHDVGFAFLFDLITRRTLLAS